MANQLFIDTVIRNTKPTVKDRRRCGLYLLIKPNGAKWWRFDYSIAGKRNTLSPAKGFTPAQGFSGLLKKLSNPIGAIHYFICHYNQTRKPAALLLQHYQTLGVLELGAIGIKVAKSADALGLNIIGFDPFMSLQSAWKLTSSAIPATSINDLVSRADFISLHILLNDKTRNLFSKHPIDRIK